MILEYCMTHQMLSHQQGQIPQMLGWTSTSHQKMLMKKLNYGIVGHVFYELD